MKNWFALIFSLLTAMSSVAARQSKTCPLVMFQAECLPSLNIPRCGHHTFFLNGEAIVIGGHTTGFIPTKTAEYYSDGQWHVLNTTYTHDQSFAIALKSGKVLIGGGHEQNLGIGQTFSVESYDPASHVFTGFGCLDTKRCFADALEIDSSRVIITGNWYHDDGIELFDGKEHFTAIKPASQHRSLPYVFRTAKDNAIVFSSHDNHAKPFDTIVIDRLQGEPFTIPLFNEWRPFYNHMMPHSSDCFIGNEQQGRYAYLFPVVNKDSLLAIVKTDGEQFSLLPTTCPIPMSSQWGNISYFSYVIADRNAHLAYIAGYGEDDYRFYVLAVDYEKTPAPLTLYYSEPQDSIAYCTPVLTDDGNLLMAGGTTGNNFHPYSTAWLLRINGQKATTCNAQLWPWLLLSALLLLSIFIILFIRRRRSATANASLAVQPLSERSEELMQRLCQLMDERQLFLNSDLKIQDVANLLGTNRTYLSDCIKLQKGISFTQFINGYRIQHAQKLLRDYPDMKISSICHSSGFATEASFFRTFKSVTGMTPKAYIAQQA